MHFSKIRTFREIHAFFHKYVLYRIPYYSKNSLFNQKFVENSPFSIEKIPYLTKSSSRIPCFPLKIPCFTKFPGFQIFKSLKNTHEKHVFSYKNIYLQIKSIYLQIKNIYKRQGVSFCIIFTVF